MATLMSPRDELSIALADLPDAFHTVDLGGDTVVVAGPTGVFLLVVGPPDTSGAAVRAATLAGTVRDALAHRLHWAPFVDALVVADAVEHADGATVIPGRLLDDTLCSGPVLLGSDTAAAIAEVLHACHNLATSA